MATYNSILFVAATLLVIMSTTPSAQANVLSGINIAQIQITGRLVCSATGNPVSGTPVVGVANAPVVLSCNGTSTTLTQVLTNPAGFFTFVINALDTLLFDASSCSVRVKLPVVNCTLLPPTGNLQAVIGFVNVIQTALGLVAVFTAQLFQIVIS